MDRVIVQGVYALRDARSPGGLVAELRRAGNTRPVTGNASAFVNGLAFVSRRGIGGRNDGFHYRIGGDLHRFRGLGHPNVDFAYGLDALGNGLGVRRGFDLRRLAANYLCEDEKHHRQRHQRANETREGFQKCTISHDLPFFKIEFKLEDEIFNRRTAAPRIYPH